MSSFGKKLAAEFEAEFARLANGWFLKWHAFARGEPAEIDDFRGGVLRLPSKAFDTATELAYWSAIRRYAGGRVDETFARIEREIGWRAGERAARTAEDGVIALRGFLERLHRHAVFTEYRLQARGYPDERYLASRRDDSIMADVQRRKVELLEKCRSKSWLRRLVLGIGSPARRLVWLAMGLTASAISIAVVFRYASMMP